MGSNAKKKTTFSKMNREAKLREKRAAKAAQKAYRKMEPTEPVVHEEEDLSHLDVAHVEGVEPDVTVKK